LQRVDPYLGEEFSKFEICHSWEDVPKTDGEYTVWWAQRYSGSTNRKAIVELYKTVAKRKDLRTFMERFARARKGATRNYVTLRVRGWREGEGQEIRVTIQGISATVPNKMRYAVWERGGGGRGNRDCRLTLFLDAP